MIRYDYVGMARHQYQGVPIYWEVFRDDRPASVAWFWREAEAKEFCDMMNARAETSTEQKVGT